MLISRPKGVLNTAVRFAFVSLPIVGVASAFVLTTNALGSLRKKDDHLNWLAGGKIPRLLALCHIEWL